MDFRGGSNRIGTPRTPDPPSFFRRNAGALLALALLLLLIHDVFGSHGFLAMRRTQKEIEELRGQITKLNAENQRLTDQVTALKSDPRIIEKIAREEMGFARPGEIIFKMPAAPGEKRNSSSGQPK